MQAQNTADQIRTDQIHYGRSAAAHTKAVDSGYSPVGHEVFLKHLEGTCAPIAVKMVGGEIVVGQIKASDRTTISIKEVITGTAAYRTRVLFKHAIAEFQPMISLAAKEVH